MPGLVEQLTEHRHEWSHELTREGGWYWRRVLDEPMAMTVKLKTMRNGRVEGVCRWTDLQRVLNASDCAVKRRGPRLVHEERKAEDIDRSAQRARSAVRDWCLRAGVDRMATFGTRKSLPFDVLLTRYQRFCDAYEYALKRDAKRKALIEVPKFIRLAVPELHTGETYTKRVRNRFLVRRAPVSDVPHYHIHVACVGEFRLDLALPIWHALCGDDFPDGVESGSTVHGSINIKRFTSRFDGEDVPSVIAGYISKYVAKSINAAFNRKAYWASRIGATEINHIIMRARDWPSAQRELTERLGIDWTALLLTHEGCLFPLPNDQGLWFKLPPWMPRAVTF